MLPADICFPIIELCNFFREICSKVLDVEILKRLDSSIAIILCKLEKIFPPSMFDVMMHLPIHLAQPAMVGGPVQYRWMYPIERFLRRLKSFVKNKARPEGAIAEAIVLQECVTFVLCTCMELRQESTGQAVMMTVMITIATHSSRFLLKLEDNLLGIDIVRWR
jgi:hypothetical protein